MHYPIIVNGTQHSIVVFQERGTLYNRQVLQPGEAVSMTRQQTGGGGAIAWLIRMTYDIHAVIGDESALPTPKQSVQNMIRLSAIPAAFCVGCLATAISGGMLAGPSAALAPLVSGMVVNGIVIDSAAIAAGVLVASRAQAVADMLIRKHPNLFMAKRSHIRPGERYFIVRGGVSDGPVVIEELKRRQFRQLKITTIKQPLPNEGTLRYYLPNSSNKDPTTKTKEDQITNTTTTTTDASSTITHGSKNNTVTNGDDSLLETTPPQQKQKQPQQYPLTCAATTF